MYKVLGSGGEGRLRGGDSTLAHARAALRVRIDARRSEIEQATLTRIYAISDPAGADPAYLEGLRLSVPVAFEYALEAIERGEERALPPPPALRAQARMAVRNGIGLDTVLRRYFAGYTVFGDYLAGEAAHAGLPGGAVPAQLLRSCAAVFDNLLAAVSEEYARESASRPRSSERRRTERVERLLAGEMLDTTGLVYDFEAHHIGLVASADGAAEAIRELAATLDCRLLLVAREEGTVWAWLGGRRRLDPRDIVLNAGSGSQVTIALGEPGENLAGWRLTHRQAAAALPIGLRREEPIVRYAEVALLASIVKDDLLESSLRQLYLSPLVREHDGGAAMRETLRAYFAADRNASSAAAYLGVNRNTVARRLRLIEERLGRTLETVAADLELALRLEAFERNPDPMSSANCLTEVTRLQHTARATLGHIDEPPRQPGQRD